MLINKIEFKNYRCFLSGEVEFQSEKPINLVVGINGSGKTELLYAISYVLHGFNFADLKSKENDPFSLNSQIYQELQKNPSIYNAYSEVILTFSHAYKDKMRTYVLSRREDYEKNKKSSIVELLSLHSYDEFGNKSVLETNKDSIDKIIEQIIPKKVLSGIIFDGERMRNLSSEDENSIKAIEGTIEDVTNLKLFTSLITDLNILERKYQTEMKKTGKKINNKQLEEVANNLVKFKDDYYSKAEILKKKKHELPVLERIIEELSLELREFQESKILENDRVNAKKNLDRIEKEVVKLKETSRDKEFKNISAVLAQKKLIEEVSELVENNKLPKGLTSSAVESILESNYCICGRKHSIETRKTMSDLVRVLPPENLNALVQEWMFDLDIISKQKINEIDLFFEILRTKEEEMESLKEEISHLSSKISNINNSDLQEKDKLKISKENEGARLSLEISSLDKELNFLENRIESLTNQQETLSKSDDKAKVIKKKLSFIQKTKEMVDRIKEINMERALKEINLYMKQAYSDISEDYPRGRRVYITQFIKEKYKLVSYYKNDLEKAMQSPELGLLTTKYKELDFSNKDHVTEALIMDVAQNNSTGQSKMMAMSFVKAILDFSSKGKKNEFSVRKQYPLVLDAPFSEISGDNLIKSAENLHKFNEQTILLSDPNTYDPLKEYIEEEIGMIYYLDKNEGESSTTIRRVL